MRVKIELVTLKDCQKLSAICEKLVGKLNYLIQKIDIELMPSLLLDAFLRLSGMICGLNQRKILLNKF